MYVKTFVFLSAILLIVNTTSAQTHFSADKLEFSTQNNIEVIQLDTDERCTSFGIKVKDSVRAHYHQRHTESLQVIKGEATMQLGDSTIQIKAGDFVVIPPETIHAVKVSSKTPLEVTSIQAPEFKGEDRHFITDN